MQKHDSSAGIDAQAELDRCHNEIAALKARLAIAERSATELAELRDLFDEAPIAYVHEGLDSRFIRANRAAVALLGIAPGAIDGTVGMSLVSITPEIQSRLRESLALLAQGRETSTELELQRRDGNGSLWVQWISRPTADCLSTRTILLDVTDRVRTAQAKAALEFSLESGQVGDWDLDLRTHTSRRSLRHDQCFGYSSPISDEASGAAGFFRHIHPQDRAGVESGMRHAIAEKIDWASEFRVIWPDKSIHWLVARGRLYRDAGDDARMLGIVMDVTERRKIEETLRETKAALDFALQSTDVGDWDLDLELNTSRRSLRHDQCFGYAEAVDEDDWGIDAFIRHIHPDDRDAVESSMGRSIVALQDWGEEFRVIWPDKSVHWLAAKGSIYSTVAGRATRMLGIVLDITARKEAEEAKRLSAAIREAAVIAERNRLAREIHDTLAQGFTGVIVQLQAAQDARERGLSEEVDAHIGKAIESARYGLQEARRSVMALRPLALDGVDLPSALATLFETMVAGTGIIAEFTVAGAPEPLPEAWEDNLLRIGQEAFTNAIRHAKAKRFQAHLAFRSEGTELVLTDDGCGFDVDTRSEGFGLLGMSERVEAMGGALSLTSVVAQGTTLRIQLLPTTEMDRH